MTRTMGARAYPSCFWPPMIKLTAGLALKDRPSFPPTFIQFRFTSSSVYTVSVSLNSGRKLELILIHVQMDIVRFHYWLQAKGGKYIYIVLIQTKDGHLCHVSKSCAESFYVNTHFVVLENTTHRNAVLRFTLILIHTICSNTFQLKTV